MFKLIMYCGPDSDYKPKLAFQHSGGSPMYKPHTNKILLFDSWDEMREFAESNKFSYHTSVVS